MAILNEINGKNHDGTAKAQVPNIFGMNFQAVSIGQKLIYTRGVPSSVATAIQQSGGYTDSIGTPSGSLKNEIEFVDLRSGMMVSAMKKQNLLHFDTNHHHREAWTVAGRYQPLFQGWSPTIRPQFWARCLPDFGVKARSDRPRMT